MIRLPWWFPFGKVPEVGPERLARRLASSEPVQLVDVRTRREFEAGHILGARHVPIHRLRAELPELGLDRRLPVVVVCLSGHRSVPAVRLFKRSGFRNAGQLAGGMKAWRSEHLPVERPEA